MKGNGKEKRILEVFARVGYVILIMILVLIVILYIFYEFFG